MSDQQLDNNSIVIRKRTFGELVDLMLRMVQKEGRYVLFWLLWLAVPFAVLNHFLTLHFVERVFDLERNSESWQYAYLMINIVLTGFELPFASSLAILYLGRRTFTPKEKPKSIEILSHWFESFPQLVFFLLILYPVSFFYECTVEIITLERTPFRSKRKDRITTFKRMRVFHRDRFGEQIGFGLAILCFCFLVMPGFWICASYGIDLLFGQMLYNRFFCTVLIFPIFLWLIYSMVIVLHFLRYLDMRIEREGWDVELAFRAERAKMKDAP